MNKIKVLFLCTGNSCRSQMAEAWAKHLKGDVIDAYSAGVEAHGLNPYMVKVMEEAGVSLEGHRSKLVDEFLDQEFDYVITVCGDAHERCPAFPARVKIAHKGFDDPPRLTKNITDEEEILKVYRRVRDEIKAFIEKMPEVLNEL